MSLDVAGSRRLVRPRNADQMRAEAEEEDEAEDEGKGGDAGGISPTSSPSPPRRSRAPPEKAQIARWPGWSSLFGTLLANDDQAVHRLAALCEQNLNASFSNRTLDCGRRARLRSRFARTGCRSRSVRAPSITRSSGRIRSATGAEQVVSAPCSAWWHRRPHLRRVVSEAARPAGCSWAAATVDVQVVPRFTLLPFPATTACRTTDRPGAYPSAGCPTTVTT